MTIKNKSDFFKNRPVATGVVTVFGVFTLGVSMALAGGFASPHQTNAEVMNTFMPSTSDILAMAGVSSSASSAAASGSSASAGDAAASSAASSASSADVSAAVLYGGSSPALSLGVGAGSSAGASSAAASGSGTDGSGAGSSASSASAAAAAAAAASTVAVVTPSQQPPPPSAPTPTCTLSASATSVAAGQSTSLVWNTNNASTVSLVGMGPVTLDGSRIVAPTQTTTYALAVSSAGVTVNCTTTVVVTNTPPPPPPSQTPTCTLSASATSIAAGQSTSLSWNTNNGSVVSISGLGNVALDGSHTVAPTQTTTYALAVSSAGATVNCTTTVVVIPPQQAPTCTLSANPTAIQQGGSATLSWSTNNASAVTINGIGQVSASGSHAVAPLQTTTYTLTAYGNGGNVNCTTTVVVTNPPPSAPTCTLTASPASLQQGNAGSLIWTTHNASSVSLSSVGSVEANGSRTIVPTQSTTYTLTVTGNGGTVNCTAIVTVVPPQQTPTCTLTASATSVVAGSSTTLSWSTANASSASISGIGSVATSGSQVVVPNQNSTYTLAVASASGTVNCTTTVVVTNPPPSAPTCTLTASPASLQQGSAGSLVWTTTNASSASLTGFGSVEASGTRTIVPTQSTTYTLTVTGNGGTVNCTAVVVVIPPPQVPSCTLTASPNSITTGGATVLTWNGTNVTSMTIDNGVGSVNPNGGSSTQYPNSSRTYTATASGPGGTVTCVTSVSVNPITYQGPTCDMSLSDYTIREGDSATLRWSSTNTSSVFINNGIGQTSQDGTRVVSPREGTYTYQGTFNGTNGQTITCLATLRVEGNHYYPPHVNLQPLPPAPLASLSLNDLPYTGLDLGPVGTALYWLALIIWSLALAYLIFWTLSPAGGRMRVAPQSHAPVAPVVAHGTYVPVQQQAAPEMHVAYSAPAPAAPATKSSYDEFKAENLAPAGALSIDDIVKGLSRQTADAHEEPAPAYRAATAPAAHAPAAPAAEAIAPRAEAQTPTPRAEAPVNHDVPTFLAALLNAEKDTVFGMIREMNKAGQNVEDFLTHVMVALDDAYRAKIDGTPVHPEVARVCDNCAPSFLEKIIASLSTAVDSSYSTGVTGVKLALTRALQTVEG